MKRLVGLFIIAIFVTVIGGANVMAQKATSKNGVTITPAFQELEVTGEESVKPATFTITNNEAVTITYQISTIDMGALDETGGLVFAGLSNSYQQKYSLANWLKLEQKEIVVPAKSTGTVNFQIINDNSFAPGGHYGAVIVRMVDAATDSGNQVSLSPQAASLLFVKKVGGEKYGLDLRESSLNQSWLRLPTEAQLNFKNNGNVHVVPRGVITVTDPFGRTVSRGIINESSAMVLPEKNRVITTKMNAISKALLPGMYRYTIEYRYDNNEVFSQSSGKFFWLNLAVTAIVVLVLGVIALLLRLAYRWIKRRRHNKPAIVIKKNNDTEVKE